MFRNPIEIAKLEQNTYLIELSKVQLLCWCVYCYKNSSAIFWFSFGYASEKNINNRICKKFTKLPFPYFYFQLFRNECTAIAIQKYINIDYMCSSLNLLTVWSQLYSTRIEIIFIYIHNTNSYWTKSIVTDNHFWLFGVKILQFRVVNTIANVMGLHKLFTLLIGWNTLLREKKTHCTCCDSGRWNGNSLYY